MKPIKPSIFLEIIWFLTFLLCLGLAIYINNSEGFRRSSLYYVLAVASLGMFLLRRYMRTRT